MLGDGDTKVALIAIDLCMLSMAEGGRLRSAVAEALGTPVSHVLLNLSHDHSSPALPEFMAMTDTARTCRSGRGTSATCSAGSSRRRWRRTAALQPARIGCGWGESTIGVYRREIRDGRDVLGEVPDHPIDPSVGVIRVDDLDGNPIAIVFRYSAHPVTVGSRSQVASSDYPGPAREVLERNLGGLALFLQGCGGNINPRVGIGYEVDCRDTKNRVGLELGGEALKIAARIRTNTRAGERRPLGNVPNILFTPWEPVDGRHLHPPRRRRDHRRARLRRAPLARAGARDPRALAADARGAARAATPSTGRSAPPRSTSTGPRSSSPRSRTGIRPTTSTSRRSA